MLLSSVNSSKSFQLVCGPSIESCIKPSGFSAVTELFKLCRRSLTVCGQKLGLKSIYCKLYSFGYPRSKWSCPSAPAVELCSVTHQKIWHTSHHLLSVLTASCYESMEWIHSDKISKFCFSTVKPLRYLAVWKHFPEKIPCVWTTICWDMRHHCLHSPQHLCIMDIISCNIFSNSSTTSSLTWSFCWRGFCWRIWYFKTLKPSTFCTLCAWVTLGLWYKERFQLFLFMFDFTE